MVNMFSNTLIEGEYLLWIPVAFCCIISFNFLCRFLCKNLRVNLIESVGQNGMLIYISHALIYVTISKLCEINEVSISTNILLLIIIY
jgi:surface polysaccharide O-acyltransferase-like enzyme